MPGAVWVLVGVAAFPLYVEFGGRFTAWLRNDGVPALLAAGGYWLSNAVFGAVTIAGGALLLGLEQRRIRRIQRDGEPEPPAPPDSYARRAKLNWWFTCVIALTGGALALWQASHQDWAGIVFGPLAALIVLLEGWMNSRHLRAMDTRQNSGE
ncbi:hypothetical protein ACT4S2_17170 [Kocuria turfanensis]|uniref:hypothetical protein n=1 Tax=Kocuria turfanensis TaxID=388357 RepID=UPI0040367D92